jgi:transposase
MPLKKLRTLVRQEVGRQAKQGRSVRLMFQDEGRFSLLGKPRRCWAPAGVRPVVGARLLRKFSYAFAAVSPHDGVMDSLILPWVNASTMSMSMFLATVSQRHPDEYIVMVMDQAGWHIAHELEVPKNMRLVLLPPYSPEINPAEHIWDALRENCIGNTVFASLDAADKALSKGLRSLESDPERMQSLTGFEWIISISLKAK